MISVHCSCKSLIFVLLIKAFILKSPANRRRTTNGNSANIESHPEEEGPDYLDLQDVQDGLAGCDYVNVPGEDTTNREIPPSAITADAVDDGEELPEYVNVAAPPLGPSSPPPVPPRNK